MAASKAMAFTRSCTRHMAMNVVSTLATCAQDAQQHRHVRGGRARKGQVRCTARVAAVVRARAVAARAAAARLAAVVRARAVAARAAAARVRAAAVAAVVRADHQLSGFVHHVSRLDRG